MKPAAFSKPKGAGGSAKKSEPLEQTSNEPPHCFSLSAANPPAKKSNKKPDYESENYTDNSDDEGSDGYRKGDCMQKETMHGP